MTDRPVHSGAIEGLLTQAQNRLHRARVAANIPRATEWAIAGATGVALLFVVLRIVQLITGHDAAPRAAGWTIGLFLGAAVPFVATMLTVWKNRPTWRETAERLDLSADDHNRVAIALALETTGDGSPFARAAIHDGIVFLERLQAMNPYLEPYRPRWHRGGAMAGFLVLLLILGAWLPQAWRGSQDGLGNSTTERVVALSGTPHRSMTEDRPQPSPTPAPAAATPQPAAPDSSVARAAAVNSPNLRTEPAGGRPGAGSTSTATSADASSSTAGQASGASPKSAPSPQPTRRPQPARKETTPSPDKLNAPGQTEQSSSVAFGSSGRGAATPVQHDWSLHAQTTAGGNEDESEDEKVEDSAESSVQRGGVQPTLKDRNEAPSRELGLAGDQGPPGAGRGGPTPPKKSRGTASLVLGVPIPDFVRGKLGPGTTKITHERVTPSAMPGEAATPVASAPRSRPESTVAPVEAPADYAAIVRAYLIALHSRDRQTEEAPPPAGIPSSTQE